MAKGRKVLPTLSKAGFVTNTTTKLDYALSHLFESEVTQSAYSRENIADIADILYRDGVVPEHIVVKMESVVDLYLREIFDQVEVKAEDRTTPEMKSHGKVWIELTIKIKDGEDSCYANRLVEVNENERKFDKVINWNYNRDIVL